ncbi:hypothetical protein K501DRAFT_271945 [Backusella circina FSU 941]|nr:hypothetical protein K501DRAFT_271944 [Backusella circina FSU 941]KAI8884139.1 hypothetical protein K501DRAFT_271945 [Backusella circina FSU 941]
MCIIYVASTKVYFILSLGANGILDLSKDSPHKDLLGSNAFNILQETYPPSLTFIDIFEDIVCVSDIEKKAKIDLSSARAYANKKENSAKGFESTIYDVYSEYLKILQFKKKEFRKDLDITEGDFAVKVRGPILESPRAILYSVRLVANGTEEGSCSLVKNGDDISNFRHTVNLL